MRNQINCITDSVRDENNVLQLWPAVTLVEQLRMPCGVCKSNDLNDTLLTVNAKYRTLSWFSTLNNIVYVVYSSTWL